MAIFIKYGCKHLLYHYQWHIQRLSDTGIPVWATKLGAQIIFSMQICQHILRHLSKTTKNVQLKTLCMPGSVAQVCLNVSQCIVCINKSNISIAPVFPN